MNQLEQDQDFTRIVADIRQQIDDGARAVGSSLPSENTLIQQYGLPRHRVRQAMKELEDAGYIERSQGRRSRVASANARLHRPACAGGRRTLALALPEYKISYSLDLLHGFMIETSRAGYQTVFYSMTMTSEKTQEFLRSIKATEFDGLAYYPEYIDPVITTALREFQSRKYPFVLLDRYASELDADFVTSDNETLGYSLGRALCERGHRRIGYAYIGSEAHKVTSVEERYKGFLRALEEAGLVHDAACTVVLNDLHADEAVYEHEIRRVLALRDSPTAFLCINDLIGRIVLRVLMQSQYRIPGDIDIALIDDDHFTRNQNLPLVVATQNGFEIGRRSAQLLMARIEDPERPFEHHFVSPDTAPVVHGEDTTTRAAT